MQVLVTVERPCGTTVSATLLRGGTELWRAWDAADAARRECAARERAAAALERRAEEAEGRCSRLASRAASDEELVASYVLSSICSSSGSLVYPRRRAGGRAGAARARRGAGHRRPGEPAGPSATGVPVGGAKPRARRVRGFEGAAPRIGRGGPAAAHEARAPRLAWTVG